MPRATASILVREPTPKGEPLDAERVLAAEIAPGFDDATLVRRALEGDTWAEEALFRRHVRVIARTVLRLLGNRSEAEDVVQDTFVSALADLHKLRDPSSARTWLIGIAVHRVHRRFRRQKLRRLLGLERASEGPLERQASPGLDPERRAELALLDAQLERLPAKDRTAWILRNVEGMSLKETADAIGCSLATIKRRIAKAEAAIRAHVDLAPPLSEVSDG